MFRAIWKLFRVMGYAITGRFTAASRAWNENKYVIEATYDKTIEKRTDRIHTVREQISSIAGIRENLKSEIAKKEENLANASRRMTGAQRAMQKRINALSGKSKEEIKSDTEFIKHNAAFMSLKSQVDALKAEVESSTTRLQKRVEQVENYKTEMQKMQRELDQLKTEKTSTIADVEIAKQEKEINDALTGLSKDTTDKDLEGIRATRDRLVNEANFSSEMAGNDVGRADAEYDEYANEAEGDAELDGLLDWGDNDASETLEDAKLEE